MLFDVIAVLSIAATTYLLYLVFFERGVDYRVPDEWYALDLDTQLRRLSLILGCPLRPLEAYQFIRSGDEYYAAVNTSIQNAETSAFVEAYILYEDQTSQRLLDALGNAADKGADVRLVIDGIGSYGTRDRFFNGLKDNKGQVVRYHPLRWGIFRRWNNRTHRNLTMIDQHTGYIGGIGFADHWQTEHASWQDCALQVSGAIVRDMQAVFAENWLESTGEILIGKEAGAEEAHQEERSQSILLAGSTPTAGASTKARLLFQLCLAAAHRSIDLCTPYFIPDRGIRDALIEARERGVRVRVLTNGASNDHQVARRAGRRRYGELLEHGVEIYEYRSRMLHAKLLVIDDLWTVFGSTNVDSRSFNLNDEVNALASSDELARAARHFFESSAAEGAIITLEQWLGRSWREKALAFLGRSLERHH